MIACQGDTMPKQKDTKKLILDTALDLFSKYGYDGVGLRDIAHIVGIRESSIYKHFANKQDLFDKLVKQMSEEYTENANSYDIEHNEKMIERYKRISENELIELCCGIFLYLAKDERASKFRKILIMEQFRNDTIGGIYKEFYFENAVNYQSIVFKELIDNGVLIKEDCNIVALQFYAPIKLLLSAYDNNNANEKKILEDLTNHIKLFVKVYSQRK